MIVPMKKYAFLVHRAEYVAFLNELRNLGVLHVQYREETPSDELLERIRTQKEIKQTLQALRTRIVKRDQADLELDERDGKAIVHSFQELSDKLEDLQTEKKGVEKEIDFWRPWGPFETDTLERLRTGGLEIRFFTCPVKQFQADWQKQYAIEVINTLPPDCYFVAVVRPGTEIDLPAEEIPPPDVSPADLQARKEKLQRQIELIYRQLDGYATLGLPAVEEALRESENMTQLLGVIENTRREAEGAVMLLEGFVPAPREKEVDAFCETREIPYLSQRARPEDAPPILLRNSAFSRLFEPIGELFSLPAYQELDLTPFFAPFFMMFFGFCLGDAGYGVVVLLGATLYKRKAKESLLPVLSLAQFLGIATIIFGILTGTVFGMNLLEDQFTALGRAREFMLDSDQTFQLALILGVVQILFGLGIKAVNRGRQFGWTYSVSSIGWILLLISILDIALLKMTGAVSTITAWVGVGIILLMNDPDSGLLSRLGKGLWELYGITGIFGDILSYIRLFALGLSSAILGFVINDIALQLRDGIPYIGPIIFIIFLVVGHGVNLLIASLGAFVHPMRLTFVEFYKNAGFAGGGKAYKPLSGEESATNE